MFERTLPSLAGRFPFRLGTTSYIVPADMETNVRLLAGHVDDVELLFFESHEISPLPGREEIRRIRDTARAGGLSCTVHLPMDCSLGARDKSERLRSAEKCLKVIDRTAMLEPFGYVVHLRREGESVGASAISDWTMRVTETLADTLARETDPATLCIENLDYPIDAHLSAAEALGASLCLDVGHLLHRGLSVEAHVEKLLSQTRIVHLHGVRDGRDHRSVADFPERTLRGLIAALGADAKTPRTVTMEVFGRDALLTSMQTMTALFNGAEPKEAELS